MPIMELYITIFCKHLYFDANVERDIQIIFTENLQPPQTQPYASNQSMFGKNMGPSSSTAAVNAQKSATKHVPLFKFRNSKPFGF